MLPRTVGVADAAVEPLLLRTFGHHRWRCNYRRGIPICQDPTTRYVHGYDDQACSIGNPYLCGWPCTYLYNKPRQLNPDFDRQLQHNRHPWVLLP